MIWALLFTALFALLGGGSPYLVPKMDKYVKKSVVDKGREKQALILLKESKKARKVQVKEDKKLDKELESLFNDSNSQQAQFDTLFLEMLGSRKNYEKTNQYVIAEVKKFITLEEWDAIRLLIKKDIEKTEKRLDKISIKTEKEFEKLKKSVEQIIETKEQQELVFKALEDFKSSAQEIFGSMVEEILNENAAHYQYEASEADLENFQSQINDGVEKLLNKQAKLHFNLVRATTEQEWKKLRKKIALPH